MEKRIYLGNAFSLSMLNSNDDEINVSVKEVKLQEVKDVLKNNLFTSAVGHQSTAEILTELLEIPVDMNRINVKLEKGNTLYVFQLLARLPEGKVLTADEIKTLPHKFFRVTVK